MQPISCIECGAALAGATKCPVCGARNEEGAPLPGIVPSLPNIEIDIDTEPVVPRKDRGRTCPNCGNEVTFDDEFVSWFCEYCKKYV